MDILCNLSVALEMLLVNLLIIDLCSGRKYSKLKTLMIFLIFTVVIVCLSYSYVSKNPHYGNGNGLFALIGVLYLIPIKIIYKESLTRIVSVICTSWIYTMLIFVFSVHITYRINPKDFVFCILLIQTSFYVVTAFPFILLVKKNLLFTLKNMSYQTNRYLMFISLCWFGTIILINLSFIYSNNYTLKIVTLTCLMMSVFLSHSLIYILVKSTKEVYRLEGIAYVDNLTGLENRASLLLDINKLIHEKKPFSLIYMDLDNFKMINDRFGHLAGDNYLKFFANYIKIILGSNGQFFRMSGDEFICIFIGSDKDKFVRHIENHPHHLPDEEIPFLGFSIGIAEYPKDSESLDELIYLADSNMYENKKKQKRLSPSILDHTKRGKSMRQ